MTELLIKAVDRDNENICYHDKEYAETISNEEAKADMVFITANHLYSTDNENSDVIFQYGYIDDKCDEIIEAEEDVSDKIKEKIQSLSFKFLG